VPELPEVEIIRRKIAPLIVGRRIKSLETTRKSYFFLTPPHVLKARLAGRKTTNLTRVGKYLLLELDDKSSLLLHLGMTGQLFAEGAQNARLLKVSDRRHGQTFKPDVHTHLMFCFADAGPRVVFRDVRKFGKCAYVAPGVRHQRLAHLGADALEIDGRALREGARTRKAPIKSVLLDQSVLAGVGNIYADEALYRARIRPTRPARSLSQDECTLLARSVRDVLKRAIALGGSSIDDYVHPDGQEGHFQNERRVYGRTGAPCPRCKTPIVRVVIGQRSTHYCPRCQV
jgi:formamidopyrimidine-DNA glycosylase